MTTAIGTLNPESLAARMVAELNENSEARSILLRTLLTDDFLMLPAKVDRLMDLPPRVERLERDVSELKAGQARLEAGQEKLEAGQEKLEAGQEKLEAGQEKLEAGQARLEAGVSRLEGRVGNMRGRNYQHRITRFVANTANHKLGMRDIRVVWSDYTPYSDELSLQILDAEDRGIITAEQGQNLGDTDIVLTGRRRSDRAETWAVIEISLTIDESDISRAADRAHTFARITRQPVTPVVIGDSIAVQDRQRAETAGVIVIIVKE